MPIIPIIVTITGGPPRVYGFGLYTLRFYGLGFALPCTNMGLTGPAGVPPDFEPTIPTVQKKLRAYREIGVSHLKGG